jgi:hypothetical protein
MEYSPFNQDRGHTMTASIGVLVSAGMLGPDRNFHFACPATKEDTLECPARQLCSFFAFVRLIDSAPVGRDEIAAGKEARPAFHFVAAGLAGFFIF